MTHENSVTETELHGYVDGFLDEQDRARVDAWIEQNPEERQKIEDWKAQATMLRTAFAPYEKSRPDDARLVAADKGHVSPHVRHALQAAAAIMIFLGGVVAGQYISMGDMQADGSTQVADISGQAQSAYLIYASEVRHPVEVGADQQPHLATWLGKRLGYPFSIPDLTAVGFDLVGGRLIPVSGKPGAMLMYQDKAGQRVTVLVGRNPQNRTTSFRMASTGGVETFYWIDQDIGYAVSGEIPQADLQRIAEECYRQFPT